MAMARCDKHTPDGIKHAYKAFALPLGYPETAATCWPSRSESHWPISRARMSVVSAGANGTAIIVIERFPQMTITHPCGNAALRHCAGRRWRDGSILLRPWLSLLGHVSGCWSNAMRLRIPVS
jgi:hypothetical protein